MLSVTQHSSLYQLPTIPCGTSARSFLSVFARGHGFGSVDAFSKPQGLSLKAWLLPICCLEHTARAWYWWSVAFSAHNGPHSFSTSECSTSLYKPGPWQAAKRRFAPEVHPLHTARSHADMSKQAEVHLGASTDLTKCLYALCRTSFFEQDLLADAHTRMQLTLSLSVFVYAIAATCCAQLVRCTDERNARRLVQAF